MTRPTDAAARNPTLPKRRHHVATDPGGVVLYKQMQGGQWRYFTIVGDPRPATRHVTPMRHTSAQARQDAHHYLNSHANAD